MICCISEPKGAALVATVFWGISITINLDFCTNTRVLSSRYSVSLRAQHSVGSRSKARCQGDKVHLKLLMLMSYILEFNTEIS